MEIRQIIKICLLKMWETVNKFNLVRIVLKNQSVSSFEISIPELPNLLITKFLHSFQIVYF